ncbi:MAG TPA: LacI family DNA-binding transcriptional regulator [Gemmatimonadaceae bacterium]|nr:LacI family DNA-binding transcriptional regulator [Gemmatimonadaceae bacterium]
MKVTIKEVAEAAGVSPATVSRVFNDTVPVDEDTRARVLAAAERLRYVPNAAARSLITSRTTTVGVLIPALSGAFLSEVMLGLDNAARRRGFHLLVSSAARDFSSATDALRAMRGRVDGVIIISPELDPLPLLGELPEEQAVVLVGTPRRETSATIVAIDNAGGAAAMVRHLVRHGHRRIALISGPEGNADARERREGYAAALAENDIARDERLETVGDFTEDGGYEAARRLLSAGPRPTAMFATNDSMAIGASTALREAGISVPDEMAIAGFGDLPIARHVTPPLSSVHVPSVELGRLALERMLFAIARQGRVAHTHDRLDCTLVLRASCGVHENAEAQAVRRHA